LLGFVINGEKFTDNKKLVNYLDKLNSKLKKFKITNAVININKSKTNKILGRKTEKILGSGFISEKISGKLFSIAVDTFLQVNTSQAEKAYQFIRDNISDNSETIIDAYCGIGTIALMIADKAEKIIGIEENSQSIKDARKNAFNNNIKNTRFVSNKVEFVDFSEYPEIACFIVDPPRKGLDQQVVIKLKEMLPKKIIYMSCNPATLARDLKELLSNNQYIIKKIIAFDFFPHTTHVESVTVLERS
jgi:23S rRNA (uracil1939-C5)-methyltransferase